MSADTAAHAPDASREDRRPQWDSAQLDLDGYLARIGYSGELAPTLATLRTLMWAHTHTVPFENLDIQLNGEIRLDLASLQDKLVWQRRGGYCHEHNTLFGTVLDRLGFPVELRSARMLLGADERTVDAVGHTIPVVTVDGVSWLVDVGVGNTGPLEPIPLVDGTRLDHGGWHYRMDLSNAGRWVVRLWRPEGWFPLYQFSEEPYYHPDVRDHNYVAATHPESPFVRRLIVERNGAAERWSLVDCRLDVHRPDRPKERRELCPAEVLELLTTRFELELAPQSRVWLVELLERRLAEGQPD